MIHLSSISRVSHRIDQLSTYRGTDTPPAYTVTKAGDRRYERFFYILDGAAAFELPSGKTVTAPKNTIVYLPYDCPYKCWWQQGEACAYIGLNFILFDQDNGIVNLSDELCAVLYDRTEKYRFLFQKIHETWVSSIDNRLECLMLFYEILHHMQLETEQDSLKQRHSKLYEAIRYLDGHYTENTPVAALAGMCNMSLTSFRRIFKAEMGVPPVKYRNRLRMQKARSLLEALDYSVSEAADAVNCTDVYYFSKLFKAEFGINPSHARRR